MVKRTLRIILILFVILELIGIFYFSSQDAATSHAQSTVVARAVARVFTPGFDGLSPHVQDGIVEGYQHVTRKAAHAVEYALLAGTLTLALHQLPPLRGAALSILASGLYATFDEWRQSGVAGRGALASDSLIDLLGASVGAALAVLLLFLIRRRRKRCKCAGHNCGSQEGMI